MASSVQHRWTSHHFIPGGKARQALAVIGQGLHYKGRSDHFWLDLLTGGVRVLRLGSGSKRGGLGTFGEMSQAMMLVKGGRVYYKPSWKDWGSPVTHYAVKNWECYKSTWMPVERVQSNKKSCDQSHVTEDQEIFLRILAENVAGVQRNGRWHSTCAQVPWTNLTLLAWSGELRLAQRDFPSLHTWRKGATSHRSRPALQRAEWQPLTWPP